MMMAFVYFLKVVNGCCEKSRGTVFMVGQFFPFCSYKVCGSYITMWKKKLLSGFAEWTTKNS